MWHKGSVDQTTWIQSNDNHVGLITINRQFLYQLKGSWKIHGREHNTLSLSTIHLLLQTYCLYFTYGKIRPRVHRPLTIPVGHFRRSIIFLIYASPLSLCFMFVKIMFLRISLIPFFLSQVWSSRDFKPVKTLSGHESKVTSLDVVGGEIT